MSIKDLDLETVAKADERFWAKHPKLSRRTLTSDPSDAQYRAEWLDLYEQAERESTIPAPSVLPQPVPSPPPVNTTSPVQACRGVPSMTHEEKMEAAIHSANLGEDVLRELGDIKTLVATMIIVGGGLAVAGVAAAATGVGLIIEGVAALGAGLLMAGAAMSGWQIGQGLKLLYQFFQETRCDTASNSRHLEDVGKKFGEGLAKVGIGTLSLLLTVLGGRGKNWRGQVIDEVPSGAPSSPKNRLTPGSIEHKAARWEEYQARGGKWDYDRWSRQYETNMQNPRRGLAREQAYRRAMGGENVTIETPYTNRQIDVFRTDDDYMGQLKTGKEYLTKENIEAIRKDASLVEQGYKVEYILEKGASEPFLQALRYAGISYKIGSQIP